jgi:hypothetical protein
MCLKSFKRLIFLTLVLAPGILFSQNGTELSAGPGIPELLNLKIKYGDNFQISGGAGFAPFIGFWAFSAGFYYHFPSKSNEDKLRKWFLNTGVSYFPPSESNGSTSQKLLLMYSRLGRTFYFNKKTNITGIDFEIGACSKSGQMKNIHRGLLVAEDQKQRILPLLDLQLA